MSRENKTEELRTEDRVSVSLNASVANTDCITRDVSASGIYLETNATANFDEPVDLVIEFDSPGGKLILKCVAEIIRVEKQDGKTGLAVKIVKSVIESAEGSIYMNSNIKVLSSTCSIGIKK